MAKWYETANAQNDVAVCSRIKFMRNIKGYPFPNKMNDEQRDAVNEMVKAAFFESDVMGLPHFQCIEMSRLSDVQAATLAERGVISDDFIFNRAHKILLLSNDEGVSIMLGDEDHITVTVVGAGLCFGRLKKIADAIDSVICSDLPIAFDEHLGFLTACPTNLGTAQISSVMLHLPALKSAGEVRHMTQSVARIGLEIHPYTDSAEQGDSAFYMLTNRVTLGITETAAIENTESIVKQLVRRETERRGELNVVYVEDTVYRAVALLQNARRLSIDEAEALLSSLRLGISEGIIKGLDVNLPIKLLLDSGVNSLLCAYGTACSEDADYLRADMIRQAMS